MIQFFCFCFFYFTQAQGIPKQHTVLCCTVNQDSYHQHHDDIQQIGPPGSPERRKDYHCQFTHIATPFSVLIGRFQLKSIGPARQIVIISKATVCIRILPVPVKVLKTIGISVQLGILISKSRKFNAEIVIFIRKFNLTCVSRHYRRDLLLQLYRQVIERVIEYFNIRYQKISFLRRDFHFIGEKAVVAFMSSKKQLSIPAAR